MVRYWIRVGVTAAVVTLMMAGCAPDDAAPEIDPAEATATIDDNGGGNSKGGNSAGGDPGDDANDGSSDPNGPGPDDPADQPTLSLPGLPIGGSTYLSIDGNHPDNQCANVNWIVQADAADLVPGAAVTVTDVVFDPQVFTVASAGCDDDAPPCPGFVFTVDAQVCNLAVAPIPGSDTNLGSYRFALVGRVDCRDIGRKQCQTFKDAVAAEPALSLGLDPPFTGTDGDGTDGSDGDGDGTGGSDGSGTDGSGTDGDGTDSSHSTDADGDGDGTDSSDSAGADGNGTGGKGTGGEGTDSDGTDSDGTPDQSDDGTGEGPDAGSPTGSGTSSGG